MKTFNKRNIALWTQLFKQWLSAKFEAIATAIANIDLSPISNDIADVKSDVADVKGDIADVKSDVGDVKTAVENIDFSTLATEANATTNKQAILDALSHISPTDPNSLALAQFFGVTLLEGYEFMQDTEVCGELEDIMQVIDPNLTAEQAAAITAQTLNPSES